MLRIIILVIALSAGVLAGWLALSLQPGVAVTTVETPAPPVPMTEVLVASSNIPQGQPLPHESLRWQAWPRDALVQGFVSRAAQPDAIKALTGSLVRSAFVAGEPIREEKLSRGASNLLASMLTPGKRAVSIRISVESTAGGFILPNDRVDVIQTIENSSRTLLTNIRVLAVDQRTEGSKGQEAVAVGKTATLELSPAQAEAVAAGQAVGMLSLALRSIADSNEEPSLRRDYSVSVRILRAGQAEFVKF